MSAGIIQRQLHLTLAGWVEHCSIDETSRSLRSKGDGADAVCCDFSFEKLSGLSNLLRPSSNLTSLVVTGNELTSLHGRANWLTLSSVCTQTAFTVCLLVKLMTFCPCPWIVSSYLALLCYAGHACSLSICQMHMLLATCQSSYLVAVHAIHKVHDTKPSCPPSCA